MIQLLKKVNQTFHI